MRLESVVVQGFKGIDYLEIKFNQGINIIKGPNEIGKSTLIKAILIGFFGNAKSHSATNIEGKSWSREDLYRIELVYWHNGERYCLKRDFEAQQQELIKMSNGEKWVDKRRIEEQIQSVLGISKESLFTSTAVVKHAELAKLSGANEEIGNLLETKVSGSGHIDIRKILKQIKEQISNLKKAGSKDPGTIAREKLRLAELQNRHAEIKAQLEFVQESVSKLALCKDALPVKNKELEISKLALEGAQKYKRCLEHIRQQEHSHDVIHKQLNDLAGYEETLQTIELEIQQLTQQLQQKRKALDLQKTFRELKALENHLTEQVTAQEGRLKDINNNLAEIGKLKAWISTHTCISEADLQASEGLAKLLEVLHQQKNKQGFQVQIKPKQAINLSFVADGQETTWQRLDQDIIIDWLQEARLSLEDLIDLEFNTKEADTEDLAEQIMEKQDAFQKILEKYNCQQLSQLHENYRTYQQTLQKLQMTEGLNRSLLQGTTLEEIENRYIHLKQELGHVVLRLEQLDIQVGSDQGFKNLADEVEQLQERITIAINTKNQAIGAINALPTSEELTASLRSQVRILRIAQDALTEVEQYACSNEDFAKMEITTRSKEDEIRQLKADITVYERNLQQQKYGIEDLMQIEERMVEVQRRIELYQHQLRVWEYLYEGLVVARGRTVAALAADMVQQIGEHIAFVTAGRYTKVRQKPGELAFEVWSPQKGEWVDPDKELSTGTRDQLYVTARLAVLKAITGTANVPIILDDTLATFDGDRRQKMLSLLKQLPDQQVIITTCQDYYDELADEVICL